jgi:hypothetical protein
MKFPGDRHNSRLSAQALEMQIGQEKKDPDVKSMSGSPTATLVLGLLEMKGEGFFRRAPRQDQIT